MKFTDDSKFDIYDEEGVLQGHGTYTIAPNGKSLLLQQPNSLQTVSVKIIEAKSGQLSITAKKYLAGIPW